MWSAKINNMANLCGPDIVGSIGRMKITKTKNNSTSASAHGSFYFRPYKSTRLITKYMIWGKLFSLVSFINILHVIPLCGMTFIESTH